MFPLSPLAQAAKRTRPRGSPSHRPSHLRRISGRSTPPSMGHSNIPSSSCRRLPRMHLPSSQRTSTASGPFTTTLELARSLVQPFSEGVLLLPANNKDMDANLEMVVVTSLIGLSWKAREVQTVKVEVPASKDIRKPRCKAGGGFFRKSWNDGKEDNVIQ